MILKRFLSALVKNKRFSIISCLWICLVFIIVEVLLYYLYWTARYGSVKDTDALMQDTIGAYRDRNWHEPQLKCEKPVFLMIIVASERNGFKQRKAIRESWASEKLLDYQMFYPMHKEFANQYLYPSPKRIKLYKNFIDFSNNASFPLNLKPRVQIVFVYGKNEAESFNSSSNQDVMAEALHYKDVIQGNFTDVHLNQTLKVFTAMKWLKVNCLSQTAYVLKVIDDTFVNIPNLLHYLLGGTIPLYDHWDPANFLYNPFDKNFCLNSTTDVLMGHLVKNQKLVTEKAHFILPLRTKPKKVYIKHLSGSAYVASSYVLNQLYETSFQVPLLPFDDVFFTGKVAAKAGIKPTNSPFFQSRFTMESCSFKAMITVHHVSAELMMEKATFVIKPITLCQQKHFEWSRKVYGPMKPWVL